MNNKGQILFIKNTKMRPRLEIDKFWLFHIEYQISTYDKKY